MRKIIHAELYSPNPSHLDRLVKNYCSCYRYCFARFQKDKLKFNDVRKNAKFKYPALNTRQISDAALQAQALYKRVKDKRIIFGGRKNWNKLIKNQLPKQQWQQIRDSQIYSRGDITKKGNPNIRLIHKRNSFYIRITIAHRTFQEYKLFMPPKFRESLFYLFISRQPYNTRLLKKDQTHYRVFIDYKIPNPEPTINFQNGAIGIDINPDRVAISEVTHDGNLKRALTIINNKIFFSNTQKRFYQISCLVKQIINYSLRHNKTIVFENLKFKKEFQNQGRKFNRKKSNFVYKKLLTLLENKCLENKISYRKVNPAFTSIIGKLKYQGMYKLSIHQAAAYVIARRGLGFNEKLSLYKVPGKPLKELVLDLAGDRTKRIHSWSLWRTLRDNQKATLTASRSSMSGLKEPDGNLRCKGEDPLGTVTSKELVRGCLND